MPIHSAQLHAWENHPLCHFWVFLLNLGTLSFCIAGEVLRRGNGNYQPQNTKKNLNRLIDYWLPKQVRDDVDQRLKGQMLVQSGLLVQPLMWVYAVTYLVAGNPWGSAYCLYGSLMAIFMLVDFRRRGNFGFAGNLFCMVSASIVMAFVFTSGGFDTVVAPWIIMVPISGFILVGRRSGIFWSGVATLFVTVLSVLEFRGVEFPQFFSPESLDVVNFFSVMGLIGYIVLILVNNDMGRQRIVQGLRAVTGELEQRNKEIVRINQGLEEKVAERTAGLQAANDELDTFLYESSHALRRPLVRIIGLLSLIETEMNDEDRARFMELVHYTAHNMDAMLKDLLIVSEVYQRQVEMEDVRLLSEVERILERANCEGAAVRVDIDPEFRVRTDRQLLVILLEKVIDNALYYRKNEGLHRVEISAGLEQGVTRIRVADNGIGIAPAALPDLYKMFARGTERSRGSGLGLFIVRKALDRLGGEIAVESSVGEGSGFELRIEN